MQRPHEAMCHLVYWNEMVPNDLAHRYPRESVPLKMGQMKHRATWKSLVGITDAVDLLASSLLV